MTDEQIDRIIELCDLDGDDQIDYHEFITATCDHKSLLTRDNLKKLFTIFDQN